MPGIPDYPHASTPLTGAEKFAVDQLGVTKYATVSDVVAVAGGGTSDVLPSDMMDADLDSQDRIGVATRSDGTHLMPAAKIRNSLNDVPIATVMAALDASYRRANLISSARLPWDINAMVIGGQSNGEGAQSVPAISTNTVPGLVMMEAIRMRQVASGSRFHSGILNSAVEVFYDDGGGIFQWGESPCRKSMEMTQNLLTQRAESPYRVHRNRILGYSSAQSSTAINNLNPGSTPWTLYQQCADYAKAQANTLGLSIGQLSEQWGQGASDYDGGQSQAAHLASLLTRADALQSDIAVRYGQKRPIFLLIIQNCAHIGRAPNNPYIAEAELQAAEQHDFIRIVNPQYAQLLENSSSHHSSRESAIIGGYGGWATFELAVAQREWDNFAPVAVVREASDLIRIDYNVMPGHLLGFDIHEVPFINGYGFYVYDTDTNLAVTMTGQPRIAPNGRSVYIKLAAAMPTNTTVIYGRGNGGNLCQIPVNPMDALTLNVSGVFEPIRRWATIFRKPAL